MRSHPRLRCGQAFETSLDTNSGHRLIVNGCRIGVWFPWLKAGDTRIGSFSLFGKSQLKTRKTRPSAAFGQLQSPGAVLRSISVDRHTALNQSIKRLSAAVLVRFDDGFRPERSPWPISELVLTGFGSFPVRKHQKSPKQEFGSVSQSRPAGPTSCSSR